MKPLGLGQFVDKHTKCIKHADIYIYLMIDEKAKFFKALGDETRLKIVSCLLTQDRCACDFTSMTERDQTTVSRHLKVLVEAGILDFEKDGRNRIYKIKDEHMRELLLNCGVEKLECCCIEC